ncbi:class I SAM-dependent methyltransferase [bacterium]|nr:class I SAM-dependent methyltransferase [Candidatus Omnitrophota bacterium]MBU3929159.1 class I SAM-dependent methyltransferase [bacterium]MBU4122439.1 class I SAM-dependent methyltransferase [bacterium]
MSLVKEYKSIRKCRVCGYGEIKTILALGRQPLANSLNKKVDNNEKKYPLTIAFCPKCSLVQLKETVRKEVLFDRYVWVTGTSATAQKYSETFFKRTVKTAGLRKGDIVVEIASNDGTFLKPFIKKGYNVLGVEPAANIAAMANRSGVNTVNKYWDMECAEFIVSKLGKPKALIARNVIPHVSELHEVIEGIYECLSPEGTGIIEFHESGKILKELHYDSIYHEHLCFFSIKSMTYLLKMHGLKPYHIDISPISGGSFVIYFSKRVKKKSPEYRKLEAGEKRNAVNNFLSWAKFADRAKRHRKESRSIMKKFKGKTVIGFGASARSSTYLNFCGFNRSHMKAIIDNNKLKQGLYAPGSALPIVSFKNGFRMKPSLIFILAWNFRDEIIAECSKNGYKGDYLVPFPKKPVLIKGCK